MQEYRPRVLKERAKTNPKLKRRLGAIAAHKEAKSKIRAAYKAAYKKQSIKRKLVGGMPRLDKGKK